MITDLFHLSEFPSMPMWYDLILLLSFAWCGLLLGFHSLKKIHNRFILRKKRSESLLFIFGIFFIGGMGIYLGRYARWNSWDIIFSPLQTVQDFLRMVQEPTFITSMLAAGVLFGIFLTLVYIQLFRLSEKKNSLTP